LNLSYDKLQEVGALLAISNMLQLAKKEAGWRMDEAVSVMMGPSEVPKVLH
jgi:hypothetical protein